MPFPTCLPSGLIPRTISKALRFYNNPTNTAHVASYACACTAVPLSYKISPRQNRQNKGLSTLTQPPNLLPLPTSSTAARRRFQTTMAANKEYVLLALENPLLGE